MTWLNPVNFIGAVIIFMLIGMLIGYNLNPENKIEDCNDRLKMCIDRVCFAFNGTVNDMEDGLKWVMTNQTR